MIFMVIIMKRKNVKVHLDVNGVHLLTERGGTQNFSIFYCRREDPATDTFKLERYEWDEHGDELYNEERWNVGEYQTMREAINRVEDIVEEYKRKEIPLHKI